MILTDRKTEALGVVPLPAFQASCHPPEVGCGVESLEASEFSGWVWKQHGGKSGMPLGGCRWVHQPSPHEVLWGS